MSYQRQAIKVFDKAAVGSMEREGFLKRLALYKKHQPYREALTLP
ncbi:hypothetical protein [Parashewanella curva]|nr:hypothetical protein [Parashewanella curva]